MKSLVDQIEKLHDYVGYLNKLIEMSKVKGTDDEFDENDQTVEYIEKFKPDVDEKVEGVDGLMQMLIESYNETLEPYGHNVKDLSIIDCLIIIKDFASDLLEFSNNPKKFDKYDDIITQKELKRYLFFH